jgi:hypothetical protein
MEVSPSPKRANTRALLAAGTGAVGGPFWSAVAKRSVDTAMAVLARKPSQCRVDAAALQKEATIRLHSRQERHCADVT